MDRITKSIKTNKPKHATVVGGGFIGLEVMEAFHQLGIQTTLLEMADQVMTPVDKEMAGFVHSEIKAKGVDLRLGVALKAVEQLDDKTLNLSLSNDEKIDTGLLIMAIGVRPETQLAAAAGIELGELGGIAVNEHMQTNDRYIYAVGDAIEIMIL